MKMLTLKQAARQLGVKRSAISEWLMVGKLRYVWDGSSSRIPFTSIERFVRENTVPMKEER